MSRLQTERSALFGQRSRVKVNTLRVPCDMRHEKCGNRSYLENAW
jgi:hypothetical protein